MMDEIVHALCRVYTISCPACGAQNRFPRLKMDVYRVQKQERDGHPLGILWRAEAEFPDWLTPLNFFWGVCTRCCFTALLDDADFRQWKKKANKFLGQYLPGTMERLATEAGTGQGVTQILGKALQPEEDPFGTLLAQFFLGIFSECLKVSPTAGNLARAYLRIAWIYRDEERLYKTFAKQSPVRDLILAAAGPWKSELPPSDDIPIAPEVVTGELEALRLALTYFERNFLDLQQAGYEEELRLMSLIAEIGYRVYELSAEEEDFKKAQNLFSGVMQRCLGIINDKSIVGGAVNRARDTLGKAGDRGRELRIFHQRRTKGRRTVPASGAVPAPPKPTNGAAAEPVESPVEEPEIGPEEPPPQKPAVKPSTPVQELQRRIDQLDEDNKRWMRLAGLSDLTGLPNRVMVSRVLLPGALKQAVARHEPLGCILTSLEGLREINGKYGRAKGDLLIQKFSDCLKELLKRGERLSHLEGVNFFLLVPSMPLFQLRKRAEFLYKDLASRRFDLEGETLSLQICMGVAAIDPPKGGSTKALQETLYTRAIQALDAAKLKGNWIEVSETR